MNPYTLIEKLAADHMLAWRFTLTMLNQMLAEVLPEHRLSGIANPNLIYPGQRVRVK